MEPIQVSGPASKGGAKVIIVCVALLLALWLGSWLWLDQVGVAAGLTAVLIVLGLYAGLAKLQEPPFFLQCDEQGVHYFHRRGSWHLPWQSFLYSAIPQHDGHELAFIAFKVTDYDAFLATLPLRLAVQIMSEQRTLYLDAVRSSCHSGQCVSELLEEKGQFETKNQRYNGIKAAFAQRMQRLGMAMGYEVYVPLSLPSDEARKLCQLINHTRLQSIPNTAA